MGLAGGLLSATGEPRVSTGPVESLASVHATARADTAFRHAAHRSLACTKCHASGGDHPGILIKSRADCRSCHHAAANVDKCATCHATDARASRVFAEVRTFSLPGGASRDRDLPFHHDLHEGIACASCHATTPERSARAVDCDGCHADHHREGAACRTCHTQTPPASAHTLEVHAGCAGSGCHADATFAAVPRARASCLVCHADHADHKPGKECATCHALPPSPTAGALGLVLHPRRVR
jgi:hypothetical protein